MIATVYFFAIADVSPCLRGKSANALAASLTMTAIIGSMFRYANGARTFQTLMLPACSCRIISPELTSNKSGIKFRYAEYGEDGNGATLGAAEQAGSACA
jgi:hypothetical protein